MTASDAALRPTPPGEPGLDPANYIVDGVTPRAVQRPRSAEAVAEALATAAAQGLTVVPQGAHTALALGGPLDGCDIALDMGALDGVVAYEADDMTVTVQAGMTLGAMQALLGEHGQYLPVDPPPDDGVTIGGLLASGRSGAWRGHLPAARDLLIGAAVALPDGSVVRSGGRVVKNVSGYDLHRLHTGALGAFGVIVEASFKLVPLPPATRSYALRCPELRAAERVALALWDAALPLRALTIVEAASAPDLGLGSAHHVLLEAAGSEAMLVHCTERIVDAAREAGAATVELHEEPWPRLRTMAGGDGATTMLRLGVPASRVVGTLEAAALHGSAWAHLAARQVLVVGEAIDADAVRALRAEAEAARGFLQIEGAPVGLRHEVDPFGLGERELVAALRAQFDPAGTINPGRWGSAS